MAAGVDAEQLVLRAEHILAMPSEYLPAIGVFVLPDGFPHFMVVWRRSTHRVVLMDPAVGVRRMTHKAFLDSLYCHTLTVPADAWRAWAGSDVFVGALRPSVGMGTITCVGLGNLTGKTRI